MVLPYHLLKGKKKVIGLIKLYKLVVREAVSNNALNKSKEGKSSVLFFKELMLHSFSSGQSFLVVITQ